MSDDFDVVVAGAGHNSLVAASYLTKAGLRCLVLEARPEIGGDTSNEEMPLPGFWQDSCSTAHSLFHASPIYQEDELHLAELGLEYVFPDPVAHISFPDGTWFTQWRDLERTCDELGKFSKRDADAYRKLLDDFGEVAGLLRAHRYTPIGFGPSLTERLAARPDGATWRRRLASSSWEIISDTFEDWHNQTYMLWMATQTVQPADRPGSGELAYSLVAGRQRHSWAVPKGGSGRLAHALARVVEQGGGAIRCDARVSELLLDRGRCCGVRTADGSEHRARLAVLSSVHIKHLVDMAPASSWGEEFRDGVETWRAGVSLFASYYAVTEPPAYPVDGGVLTPLASGTASSPERELRLSRDFRLGEVDLEDPTLLVLCPTVSDPSRAPEGRHTLKIVGMCPYDLPGGPERWDDIKEEVADAHLRQLRRFAPNLTDDKVLGRVVRSPLDLERFNSHNWHGSCHGGDLSPAQSQDMRPVPGWASHRMPIAGLYQTGGTTHPGGSVSGGPGRNAAAVMLKDLLGLGLEQVVAGGTASVASGRGSGSGGR
ncbi:MAG: phytoene desaturase family protein [Acidimicrobiales bacterium]